MLRMHLSFKEIPIDALFYLGQKKTTQRCMKLAVRCWLGSDKKLAIFFPRERGSERERKMLRFLRPNERCHFDANAAFTKMSVDEIAIQKLE